jgi:hypothetical protein
VRFALVISMLLAATTGIPGCARMVELPPQATVSQVEPSGRAAKPPDCDLPILRHEPLADFRKVAIIEGEGSVYASEVDVLAAVRRKACETGADALVIVTSRSQTSESLTGYYINAIAIVYGKRDPAAEGSAAQFLH